MSDEEQKDGGLGFAKEDAETPTDNKVGGASKLLNDSDDSSGDEYDNRVSKMTTNSNQF